jgi:hypothetical protein
MKRLYTFEVIALGCCFLLLACNRGTQKPGGVAEALPPVEAMAQVDRATATTGDPIRYTLTATSDPQIEVTIPEMGAQIAGLRIIDIGSTGPLERDGRKIMSRWYELRADVVGSYIIPGAVFTYRDEQGKTQDLKTAQIFIEVKSVIEDTEAATDIKDIKPLAIIPRDYTVIIVLSLAFLLLIALVGGGIYIYRTRFRKTMATPSSPAHELALQELEQLRKEDLISKGIYKEHYFKLSEIFRRYLERRFHFQAVEHTTEEILPALRNLNGVDEKEKATAQQFLRHTDLVKFAKHIPDTDEVENEHQEAVTFIHKTKEEPVNKPTD